MPSPAAGLPDYTKNQEIDLEPSGPSIDAYMRVRRMDGSEEIIHLRFQKWYQPDLDRHLFDLSRKVKRKYGKQPTVLVFLLWPPAGGPGTTGRFREVDDRGKVKRVFNYAIKRAWEMMGMRVHLQNSTDLLTICTAATDVHEFSEKRDGLRPRQMAAKQAEDLKRG